MKLSSFAPAGAAVALCGVGVLSFILGIVVFFGAWMKDRRSDPDPTLVQVIIGVAVGWLILASSIACFIVAARRVRQISKIEAPAKNVR
jgi:hypothetical protein